jgi:hypothetical protein
MAGGGEDLILLPAYYSRIYGKGRNTDEASLGEGTDE